MPAWSVNGVIKHLERDRSISGGNDGTDPVIDATSPPRQDTSRGEERRGRYVDGKPGNAGRALDVSSTHTHVALGPLPAGFGYAKTRLCLRKVGTFLETYTPTGCAVCTTSARKGNDSY
jgi:hypothetical protein